MIESPKRSAEELEMLNTLLTALNQQLMARVAELLLAQPAGSVAQVAAGSVTNAEASALLDFFRQLTHYDYCGDNPADLRKALSAQATVNKLLSAQAGHSAPPSGKPSTGGVGAMRARIDESTGDIVGYFAHDVSPAPAQPVVATPDNAADELDAQRARIKKETLDIVANFPSPAAQARAAERAVLIGEMTAILDSLPSIEERVRCDNCNRSGLAHTFCTNTNCSMCGGSGYVSKPRQPLPKTDV